MVVPSRRLIIAASFLALMVWRIPVTFAADAVWPSPVWTKVLDPAALGWSTENLQKAEAYTQSYAPTAVMIVQDGHVIAAWGDTAHKVNVRSVRKSLISALYGIGAAEGRIKLDQTIGELVLTTGPRACQKANNRRRSAIC
jgi:CubicO group peptidase (beta-lactamase class C family)